MSLIQINPGDEADATILMGNFNDLDGRITETATSLNTTVSNVNSTIQNTLSIYQDIVQPKNSFDDDATTVTSGNCYIKSNTIVAFTPTGNVTFVLPTITDKTKFYQILVQIKLTNTAYVSASSSRLGTTHYFNDITPRFTYTGYYDIVYAYNSLKGDNGKWCVGAIYKGAL